MKRSDFLDADLISFREREFFVDLRAYLCVDEYRWRHIKCGDVLSECVRQAYDLCRRCPGLCGVDATDDVLMSKLFNLEFELK